METNQIKQAISVLDELDRVFKEIQTTYKNGVIVNSTGQNSFMQASFDRLIELKDRHMEIAKCEQMEDTMLKLIIRTIMTTTRRYANPNPDYFHTYSTSDVDQNGYPYSYVSALDNTSVIMKYDFDTPLQQTINDLVKITQIIHNQDTDLVYDMGNPRDVLLLQLSSYVKSTYYNNQLSVINKLIADNKQLHSQIDELKQTQADMKQTMSNYYNRLIDSGMLQEPIEYDYDEYRERIAPFKAELLQTQKVLIRVVRRHLDIPVATAMSIAK